MHRFRIAFPVIVLLLSAAGPVGTAAETVPGDFGRLLERAVASPGEWSSVRIEADGRLADDVRKLTVYGRGIGIWNGERQFELTAKETKAVLRLLVERKFADLPELLGGEEEEARDEAGIRERPLDPPPPGGKKAEAPRYLLRTLSVTVGDVTRTVIQEAEVPEAAPFEKLLADLVELCRKPAANGIGALDLASGLRMVADGKLAPETLSLLVNAPQLRSLPSQEGQGWILEVRHARLSDATQALGRGVVHRTHRGMQPEEIRELARKLLDAGASSLPARIHTTGYTHLTIQVLNHKVNVMARTYAGTPDAAAKKAAARFARVRAILHSLHESPSD